MACFSFQALEYLKRSIHEELEQNRGIEEEIGKQKPRCRGMASNTQIKTTFQKAQFHSMAHLVSRHGTFGVVAWKTLSSRKPKSKDSMPQHEESLQKE